MIYSDITSLEKVIGDFKSTLEGKAGSGVSGICGFDGFIDTFIRVEAPSSMAEFGPKVAAAAGIAASYPVRHEGDKFGGNGPLFVSALHGLHGPQADLTYIGALGKEEILPIFSEALDGKVNRLFSLADPAHSDCLEFTDGKVMLSDLRSCSEITWERLLECVEAAALDNLLKQAQFIAAVNWGKLVNVGSIWKNLSARHREIGGKSKKLFFFMDLAEFEQRPEADRESLLELVKEITEHCQTMLSFNLKEAWQMGESLGGGFSGQKEPEQVLALATFLKENISADRIIIHPNSGAACASDQGSVYVAGPYCESPLISTGAGDNFGAGCLAAALLGMDDAGIIFTGNCASGYYVRTGRSASFDELSGLVDLWVSGDLPERL